MWVIIILEIILIVLYFLYSIDPFLFELASFEFLLFLTNDPKLAGYLLSLLKSTILVFIETCESILGVVIETSRWLDDEFFDRLAPIVEFFWLHAQKFFDSISAFDFWIGLNFGLLAIMLFISLFFFFRQKFETWLVLWVDIWKLFISGSKSK